MGGSKVVWLAAGVGGTIGGFIPELWGAGILSMWSILFSTLGGIAGIWLAAKYS